MLVKKRLDPLNIRFICYADRGLGNLIEWVEKG